MHTFLLWMRSNVLAAQGALLQALAYRDDLQFVQAPKIHREYMDRIGQFEQEAMEKELDAVLLEKKKRMIQTCINRREKIDMEKIDAQLNEEREKLLKRAGMAQVQEQHTLTAEEEEELHKLYKEIVESFHPSVHPNLTDMQKTLFNKAVEAYQHMDLTMLRLISDMLRGDVITISFEVSLSVEEVDLKEEAKKLADMLTEDYTLAKEVFGFIKPLQQEMILQGTADEYHAQCSDVLRQIEEMYAKFPFTARETLADEEKIETYLLQVRSRIAKADADIARLNESIAQMMEEAERE